MRDGGLGRGRAPWVSGPKTTRQSSEAVMDNLQHTSLDRLRKDALRDLAQRWVSGLMADVHWLDERARDPNATSEQLRAVIQKCYWARTRI